MSRPRPKPKPPNLLAESGLPLAYPITVAPGDALAPAENAAFDVSLRTGVRSLTVMQKEAVVARSDSTLGWRLASDEGPYLGGHDFAPAPLAFLTTGLAADMLFGVRKSLAAAGIDSLREVVLNTHFTIEGSLPRGTMIGGAGNPEVQVHLGRTGRSVAVPAVLTGVRGSAASGLIASTLTNAFTLTSNGSQISVGRVREITEPAPRELDLPRSSPPMRRPALEPIITKTFDVGEHPPDAGVSLQKDQRRRLNLEASARFRADGVAAIETRVLRPTGSTFRFLADETGRGGAGRAPDAACYLSAGIGFCFMTQFGRYAKILGRTLGDYHILQDTSFGYGDSTAEPPVGGRSAPVRTHVYLSPDGDDDFARDAVDMSEQTCFVHALCRTELRPKVRVVTGD